MLTGARVDHFRVTMSLDGVDFGIWDTKEGGETDSEETRYKPGGGPEEPLGGKQTVTQLTVTRMFRRGRDDELMSLLRRKSGSGEAIVKVVNTDADGNPWSTGETYKGVLKRVAPPQIDSNSSDVAMITAEITPRSSVA